MCIGLPMRVRQVHPSGLVMCSTSPEEDKLRPVDTSLLVHMPAADDWLLVHVNIALRELGPEEARQISDALLAVEAAAAGAPFEHLIADLIDREPELPPHLRAPSPAEAES